MAFPLNPAITFLLFLSAVAPGLSSPSSAWLLFSLAKRSLSLLNLASCSSLFL
jgi:hypothetical protein